jgi:hypothetical protein
LLDSARHTPGDSPARDSASANRSRSLRIRTVSRCSPDSRSSAPTPTDADADPYRQTVDPRKIRSQGPPSSWNNVSTRACALGRDTSPSTWTIYPTCVQVGSEKVALIFGRRINRRRFPQQVPFRTDHSITSEVWYRSLSFVAKRCQWRVVRVLPNPAALLRLAGCPRRSPRRMAGRRQALPLRNQTQRRTLAERCKPQPRSRHSETRKAPPKRSLDIHRLAGRNPPTKKQPPPRPIVK